MNELLFSFIYAQNHIHAYICGGEGGGTRVRACIYLCTKHLANGVSVYNLS